MARQGVDDRQAGERAAARGVVASREAAAIVLARVLKRNKQAENRDLPAYVALRGE